VNVLAGGDIHSIAYSQLLGTPDNVAIMWPSSGINHLFLSFPNAPKARAFPF